MKTPRREFLNSLLAEQSRGALPAARIAIDDPDIVSHLVLFDNNALASGNIKMAERADVPTDREAWTRESTSAPRWRHRCTFAKISDGCLHRRPAPNRLGARHDGDSREGHWAGRTSPAQ